MSRSPDAAKRQQSGDNKDYVYAHDSNCNDYTGCNDGCGWILRSVAIYRMGAWRRA